MIDNRTANKNFPLPHKDNELADDVQRLRTALSNIDAALVAEETARASAVAGESTARAAAITAESTARATAIAAETAARVAQKTEIDTAHAAAREALRATLTAQISTSVALPTGLSLSYNSDGNVSQLSETWPSQPARTTAITYANGRVSTVSITQDGHTRTETYSYDAAGNLTGMNATET